MEDSNYIDITRSQFFLTQAKLRDFAEQYNLIAFYFEDMFLIWPKNVMDILNALDIIDNVPDKLR